MSLPFPIPKYYHVHKKSSWSISGMIFVDDEHFQYVYNEFIHAKNCDLCNKLFLKSRDRQLDHDHDTGEIRNIVCNKCNCCKKDKRIQSNNTSGYQYISKSVNGFYIKIMREGNYIINASRNTLEEAIICRDEFIAAHLDIYT